MVAPTKTNTKREPWQIERDEKAELLKALTDSTMDRLAHDLSAGHSEQYLELLSFWSRFWKYSRSNVLLVLLQRPDAWQVASWRTWKRQGYTIKPEAIPIWIWTPIIRKVTDARTGQESSALTGFRPGKVFASADLVEIHDRPLPMLFTGVPDDTQSLVLYETLASAIRTTGVTVLETDRDGRRHGFNAPNLIGVGDYLTSQAKFQVLCHEYAHELMRGMDTDSLPYVIHEHAAEAAAYVISAAHGIEATTSIDYLLIYHCTADDLRTVLGFVQRIVKQTMQLLARHEIEFELQAGVS